MKNERIGCLGSVRQETGRETAKGNLPSKAFEDLANDTLESVPARFPRINSSMEK